MTHGNRTDAVLSVPGSNDTVPMRARRVFIYDEHPVVRQGLLRVLQHEADMIVCGESATVRGVVDAIRQLAPHLLICGIGEGHADSMCLVREVREHHPQVAVLVFSAQDEVLYAERMLAMGASGYITKQATSEELLASMRRVLNGEIYVSAALRSNVPSSYAGAGAPPHADPLARLSSRELQVLRMIGDGMSTRETARSLGLSVKTVESHRQNIKRKLHLKNAIQLLRYAVLAASERPASSP